MDVHGAGNGMALPPGLAKSIATAEATGATGQSAPIRPSSQDSEGSKGVVRLLEAGHFRGVADVRLRINFAGELSGAARTRTAAETPDAVLDLLGAVDAVVSEFVASPDLNAETAAAVVELHAVFTAAVSGLIDLFVGDTEVGIDQLLNDLQTAFDEFVTALTAPFAAPPTAPAQGDATVTTSISIEVSFTASVTSVSSAGSELPEEFQAFVDALQQAFTQALSDFGAAMLSAADALPELSEANGNGAAYAKFLEQLNALQGDGESANAPGEGTDLIA